MSKVEQEKELQNQTLANVPIGLWRRFKSACATRGLTMTQGFIEAAKLWLITPKGE